MFNVIFYILCISTSTLSVVIEQNEPSESKYQVIRILPTNESQLLFIYQLYTNSKYPEENLELDFWQIPRAIDTKIDLMINTKNYSFILNSLQHYNIASSVIISDVQRLILEREVEEVLKADNGLKNSSVINSFSKRLKDSEKSRNKAKFSFGGYHSYNKILSWLGDIEYFYPDIAKVFTIGTTYEGRNIKGIKIGNEVKRIDKRIIWIDGGMHAREWTSIHTALYFIDQLISGYGTDPQITSYMNMLNFYILPAANPDGYEYSRSNISPKTRFWRKNRGQQKCFKDHWHREKCCGGVDLNRNFDFHWGETGSSGDECSDIYQGDKAFSEPESRAIRDIILSPEMYGKVDAFITLHAYSQMWIHPFSHRRHTFPSNFIQLRNVAEKGVKALKSVYGTKYRIGTGADILYPSAGGSDDWAKEKANVNFVYLLELRPGESEIDGFLLDRKELIPTGRETWEGIRVVISAVMMLQNAIVPSVTFDVSRKFLRLTQQSFIATTRRYEGATTGKRRRKLLNHNFHPNVIAKQSFQLNNSETQICRDITPWCSSWIKNDPNICQTSIILMRDQCTQSCHFC